MFHILLLNINKSRYALHFTDVYAKTWSPL